MCNLSEGIAAEARAAGYNSGRVEGYNSGRVEGYNSGHTEGYNSGRAELVKSFLELGTVPVEAIQQATGWSREQINALKN